MDIDRLFNELGPPFLGPEDVVISDSEWTDEPAMTGDFERLVRFAEPLVNDYDDVSSPEWEVSPIGWIRQVSSAHKRGKVGEELVRAWAQSEELGVGGRGHRGHDCVVAGLKIEVKTSLRWNNDRFVFLGLRDFDYDAVALLGLEPNDFGLWIVPKQLLWYHAKQQLRGVSGEGSKWLSFLVSEPPAWLAQWGGSFADARKAIQRVLSYPVKPSSAKSDPDREITDAWLKLSTEIDWPWHSNPDDHLQPQQQPISTQIKRNDSDADN